jgi:hypothetical protein
MVCRAGYHAVRDTAELIGHRVFVLLCAHPERSWTAQAIAPQERVAASIAEDAPRLLCRDALLSVQVGSSTLLFKYSPRPLDLGALVNKCVQAYEEQTCVRG